MVKGRRSVPPAVCSSAPTSFAPVRGCRSWLRNFDNNTGLGSVNGVTSTLATGGWNRSPYFDDLGIQTTRTAA